MYAFINDYSEGCHPAILEALSATNLVQTVGYGFDEYSEKAKSLIKKACNNKDLDIHFLVGGTQTNETIIRSILRPHQGVFGATTSHINTHEAGAIEFTGHKVITIPTSDGKITSEDITKHYEKYLNDPTKLHWVEPKMVYISQPTEIGTLYSRQELTAIYEVCQKYKLYLFIDGARLGYGLTSPANDLTLVDIAKLCDVFYIGGTKCGALLGEAVVIVNEKLKTSFFTLSKQGGAVLAKGRILGIQFATLFTDDLYFKIRTQANIFANNIASACTSVGWKLLGSSPTNQNFIIMPNKALEYLSSLFALDVGEKYDDKHTIVRICTSWCTKEAEVKKLIEAINTFKK